MSQIASIKSTVQPSNNVRATKSNHSSAHLKHAEIQTEYKELDRYILSQIQILYLLSICCGNQPMQWLLSSTPQKKYFESKRYICTTSPSFQSEEATIGKQCTSHSGKDYRFERNPLWENRFKSERGIHKDSCSCRQPGLVLS